MKKLFSVMTLATALGALMLVVHAAPQLPSARAGGRLTIDQLIDIRHPSNPVWSPDGRRVAFLSERAGIANIYVADVTSTSEVMSGARALTRFADGGGAGLFWSADSQRIYFPRGGDLWQVTASGGEPSAVWSTPQTESGITPSPDGTRVAFVRSASAPAASAPASGRGGRGGGVGGDLMVRSLADGKESMVVHTGDHPIGGVGWSPDGASIVFTDNARTIRHEQTPAYSGAKIIYTITENVPGETMVVAASGGAPRALGSGGGGGGARRWMDATRFLVDRTSPDFKRRTTAVVSTKAASRRPFTKRSRINSGASPATRDRSRHPTADGLRSSAIATAGITST